MAGQLNVVLKDSPTNQGVGFWTEEIFVLLHSDRGDTEFSEVRDPRVLNQLKDTIASMSIEDLRFPVMKFAIDKNSPHLTELERDHVYSEIAERGIGP